MKRSLTSFVHSQNLVLALIVIVGTALLGVSSGGGFFGPISITTFFTFLAVPILIGLAQMITLAVGQLNLAVGSIGGFAACLAGVLIADLGVPPVLGGLAAVLVGAIAGLANGLLVVVTRINGFIVTLATMTILLGMQYGLVGTRTISNTSWPELAALGKAALLGVPVIFWIAVLIAVLLAFGFTQTVTGRRLLASGGNATAAQLAGVSNDRSVVVAHTASGLLCGIAAFVTLASLSGVNQSIGGDWLLSSFAAPIIGGVSLTGGSVAVLGTVLAATIVRLVDSARAEFQLAPSWVNFVVGAVVLGTVALGRVREVRAARAATAPPPGGASIGTPLATDPTEPPAAPRPLVDSTPGGDR
ncbi:MAG: ABC transporter permease [Herbiconiux sp.]|nr:ABC transporter permease [Herbiconiux sp.]